MFWTWTFPQDATDDEPYSLEGIYMFVVQLIALVSSPKSLQKAHLYFCFFHLGHVLAHFTQDPRWYFATHYGFFCGVLFLAHAYRHVHSTTLINMLFFDTCSICLLGHIGGIASALSLLVWSIWPRKQLRIFFLIATILSFVSLIVFDYLIGHEHSTTESLLSITFTVCIVLLYNYPPRTEKQA